MPPDTRELYLDLLSRSLTGLLDPGEAVGFEPSRFWLRRLWQPIRRALAGTKLEVVRRVPPRRELREEGRAWPLPASAKTMVGLYRLENVRQCVRRVIDDDVPGDLLEAGTWRGGAAIMMRGALEAYGDTSRSVWVADSFQGVPRPDTDQYPADMGDLYWSYGELAVPKSVVAANFDAYGLLDDRVRFLEGWFKDTLPSAPVDRLAVLRLDGDLYESTRDVLDNLGHKVSPGGFVIVDDYGCVPGCRRAVDEFREEHGITEHLEVIDWTGVYWRRGPH